ncbi:MAG: NAD(P)H-binding protein [Actinomycetota bacterium]|nr:NAD(P)H-binding protein [Actinomycetota bacterium]
MKLTIVGATGGVGGLAVRQSVAAGHQVTAVARNPAKLPADVRRVAADLAAPDLDALRAAVRGADAVLCCIGPRSKAEIGIVASGTAAIIAAMQAEGVGRVVVISAAPVSTLPSPARPSPPRHDPGDGFLMRQLGVRVTRMVFRNQYADLALMEDALRASDLQWTIVRPPRLTDKAFTGRYRTAIGRNVRGGVSVSRADLADAMLRAAAQPETIRASVGVAN